MLRGKEITLRPVRQADVDAMYDAHADIANRGAFFPLGVLSESAFKRRFAETGFWEKEEGPSSSRLPTPRSPATSSSSSRSTTGTRSTRRTSSTTSSSPGAAGSARRSSSMTDYLFANKKQNRIQLVIVPENAASRRIAEKCGYQLEGTARGAFYNDGRNKDVLIFSLLRDDPRPWRR